MENFKIHIVSQSEEEIRFTVEEGTDIQSMSVDAFLKHFNETETPGVFVSVITPEEEAKIDRMRIRVETFDPADLIIAYSMYLSLKNPTLAEEPAVMLGAMMLSKKYRKSFPEDNQDDFFETILNALAIHNLIKY